MRKKYLTTIAIAIMICIFCISYYRILIVSQNNDFDKQKEVKQFVSQYYEKLSEQNYEAALSQIYYNTAAYEKDISQIKNQAIDYKISYPPDSQSWVRNVIFDQKEKAYAVEATAQISYKTKNWIASEIVYVKNIDKELKIIKILTDDIYCSLRGSKAVFIGTNK